MFLNNFLCPFCMEKSETRLYVHGHLQCPKCKKVVDDCCQGETVNEEEQIIQ